jgi:hypothetical protein
LASPTSLRVRSASRVENGIFAPSQRVISAGFGGASRTHAVISRTRRNSSTRPANTKQSPGRSIAMNASSTIPSLRPLRNCTVMLESDTIVPICVRWRRAIWRSGTCATPCASMTTRRYSGYALRLAPPWTTKSSAHCHCASSSDA